VGTKIHPPDPIPVGSPLLPPSRVPIRNGDVPPALRGLPPTTRGRAAPPPKPKRRLERYTGRPSASGVGFVGAMTVEARRRCYRRRNQSYLLAMEEGEGGA